MQITRYFLLVIIWSYKQESKNNVNTNKTNPDTDLTFNTKYQSLGYLF